MKVIYFSCISICTLFLLCCYDGLDTKGSIDQNSYRLKDREEKHTDTSEISIEHDSNSGQFNIKPIQDAKVTLFLERLDDYSGAVKDTFSYNCIDFTCPSSKQEAMEILNTIGEIYNLRVTVSVERKDSVLARKVYEGLSFMIFSNSDLGFVNQGF